MLRDLVRQITLPFWKDGSPLTIISSSVSSLTFQATIQALPARNTGTPLCLVAAALTLLSTKTCSTASLDAR